MILKKEVNCLKKNVLRILLDISMLVIYFLLTFDIGLGMFFHEVFGIIIGIVFIGHIILNRKLLVSLFKSVSKNGIFTLGGLKLTLNILLVLNTAIIMITGILISNQLFNFDTEANHLAFIHIHKIVSYLCLGILLIHTLSHFKFIKSVLKQIKLNYKKPEIRKVIVTFSFSVFAILIIYSCTFLVKSKHDNFIDYKSTADGSYQSNDKKNTISTSKGSDSGNKNDNRSVITENTPEDPPTLAEYLSKLRCTACPKHCFLTNPRCNRGQTQKQEATNDYNKLYLKTE